MKTEKLITKVLGFTPEDFNQYDITFSGSSKSEELHVIYKSNEPIVLGVDDNNVYDEDGNFLFFLEDLEVFENFLEYNECPTCKNEKEYYSEELKECGVSAAYCCGGCTETILVECDCEDKPFKY
jgi:hypothetical protein